MAANMGREAPDDDWLGKINEPALEPDLAIIDPHHHLWLRDGHTYLMPELAIDLASGTISSPRYSPNAMPCTARTGRRPNAPWARRNLSAARPP
jgi:hypothetical protein